uniref:Uncharacterized protein n=1 Tax=Anguilla anguilla TaxID=7936 RepID=A0A0E9Q2C5_ANGAN
MQISVKMKMKACFNRDFHMVSAFVVLFVEDLKVYCLLAISLGRRRQKRACGI